MVTQEVRQQRLNGNVGGSNHEAHSPKRDRLLSRPRRRSSSSSATTEITTSDGIDETVPASKDRLAAALDGPSDDGGMAKRRGKRRKRRRGVRGRYHTAQTSLQSAFFARAWRHRQQRCDGFTMGRQQVAVTTMVLRSLPGAATLDSPRWSLPATHNNRRRMMVMIRWQDDKRRGGGQERGWRWRLVLRGLGLGY
ncbi:unnamed protein product [Lactuca virosa]|uniref:Uncharacterized protein n=1 Tax=Lactuca virosa TaxID=75947 RepID=A0AAU9MX84_9ASTR|nr:unnamed protein product [Lactuca virosa]